MRGKVVPARQRLLRQHSRLDWLALDSRLDAGLWIFRLELVLVYERLVDDFREALREVQYLLVRRLVVEEPNIHRAKGNLLDHPVLALRLLEFVDLVAALDFEVGAEVVALVALLFASLSIGLIILIAARTLQHFAETSDLKLLHVEL